MRLSIQVSDLVFCEGLFFLHPYFVSQFRLKFEVVMPYECWRSCCIYVCLMEGQVQPQTYYCSLSWDSSNEKQLLTFLLMNEILFFHGRCSKILKMLRSPDESLSYLGKRTRKDKVKSLMNAWTESRISESPFSIRVGIFHTHLIPHYFSIQNWKTRMVCQRVNLFSFSFYHLTTLSLLYSTWCPCYNVF